MIKVSVIIPVYNRLAFCRTALDMLRNQTLTEIEFLMYDDGSTDGSYEWLVEHTRGDDRFRIVKQPQNMGPSVARNMGIASARGEYIGFFDIDDAVPNDYWEKLYTAATTNGTDIAFCAHNSIRHTTTGVVHSVPDKIRALRNGASWDKIYRRSMVLTHGIEFPTGLYTADNVFVLKCMYHAYGVCLVNEPVYSYTLAPDSISSDTAKMIKRKRDIITVIGLICDFARAQKFTAESMRELYDFINRTVGGYGDDPEFLANWSRAMAPFATEQKKQEQIRTQGRISMRVLLVKLGRALGIIPRRKYKEKLLYARIMSSGLMNRRYYLAHNPDVRRAGANPVRHYVKYGWGEGRNPSPEFSTRAYLADYPDVAAANICPLAHYIEYGRAEGRVVRPVGGGNGKVGHAKSHRRGISLGDILTYPVRVRTEYEYLKSITESKTQK